MVLAYLESLSYLDYALIEPLDRHNAKEVCVPPVPCVESQLLIRI